MTLNKIHFIIVITRLDRYQAVAIYIDVRPVCTLYLYFEQKKKSQIHLEIEKKRKMFCKSLKVQLSVNILDGLAWLRVQ